MTYSTKNLSMAKFLSEDHHWCAAFCSAVNELDHSEILCLLVFLRKVGGGGMEIDGGHETAKRLASRWSAFLHCVFLLLS